MDERVSKRRRRALFALALAVLLVGAVGLSVDGRRSLIPIGGPAVGEPASAGPAPSANGSLRARHRFEARLRRLAARRIRSVENHRVPRRLRREVSRVATGFARAYLAYEISQGGAKQRRVLSALGTESLSRQLLAAPVRAPAHGRLPVERVERVGEVRNATSEGRPAFTAAVVVDRDGLPVVLNLRMVGLPGRLRVAELGR